ncbi:MAG TPA: hypothetical protein VGA99_01955 [bacterium]
MDVHLKKILNATLPMLIMYQTSAPAVRQEPKASLYFPVNVGDEWNYQNFEKGFEWSIKVVGIKNIADRNYFVFVRSLGKSSYRDTSYYRVEGSKVLIHYFGQDYLLVDFNRDPAGTWDSYGVIKAAMLHAGSRVSSPVGVFNGVYEVRFEIPGSAGSERVCKYAPGVGLVEYQTSGSISRLIQARVSGRVLQSQELTSFSEEKN